MQKRASRDTRARRGRATFARRRRRGRGAAAANSTAVSYLYRCVTAIRIAVLMIYNTPAL